MRNVLQFDSDDADIITQSLVIMFCLSDETNDLVYSFLDSIRKQRKDGAARGRAMVSKWDGVTYDDVGQHFFTVADPFHLSVSPSDESIYAWTAIISVASTSEIGMGRLCELCNILQSANGDSYAVLLKDEEITIGDALKHLQAGDVVRV